jgi:hypothetical protein
MRATMARGHRRGKTLDEDDDPEDEWVAPVKTRI